MEGNQYLLVVSVIISFNPPRQVFSHFIYKGAASHNILNPGHAGAAADLRLYDAAALHIRRRKHEEILR